jgi:protein tyrosine phosphatase (PTP) superfamily phosphohydrolase (DUF442 family)
MKVPIEDVTREDVERFVQTLEKLEPYLLLYGRANVRELETALYIIKTFVNRLRYNIEWLRKRELDIP